MIFLKRYNTCFIRVPKTASQAVLYFFYQNVYSSSDITSKDIIFNKVSNTLRYTKRNLAFNTAHLTAEDLIKGGIVSGNTNFYAVIRNPYEKQLSLYIYRIKKGTYGHTLPSVDHFRSLLSNGILQDKREHHMLPQYKFLEYDGAQVGIFWLYDTLEKDLIDFCNTNEIAIKHPLKKINTSPGDKSKLIDKFYTKHLKKQVREAYERDFQIYEELLRNK